MARFNQGQELVCINDSGWFEQNSKKEAIGPKFNEIVTYDGHAHTTFIYLKEYGIGDGTRNRYDETFFVPVVSTDELMEALAVQEDVMAHAIRERKRSKAWI